MFSFLNEGAVKWSGPALQFSLSMLFPSHVDTSRRSEM
jgi:hypothetical protein